MKYQDVSHAAAEALRAIRMVKSESEDTEITAKIPVLILRTGTFKHPFYGEQHWDLEYLNGLLQNFRAEVYPQKIAFNVGHKPDSEMGSLGWLEDRSDLKIQEVEFRCQGESRKESFLLAMPTMTEEGLEKLASKRYRYISSEIRNNYTTYEAIPSKEMNEDGEEIVVKTEKTYGPTLTGFAATNKPFVPHLQHGYAGDEKVEIMMSDFESDVLSFNDETNNKMFFALDFDSYQKDETEELLVFEDDEEMNSLWAEIQKWDEEFADKTNFPQKGDNKKVSLSNSQYKRFPVDEASSIRENFPDIWRKGGNIKGNAQFAILSKIVKENGGEPKTKSQEQAIRLREAWSARHLKDFRPAGVIAQVKWLTVGSRGLDHMRSVIREMKQKEQKSSVDFSTQGDSMTFSDALKGLQELATAREKIKYLEDLRASEMGFSDSETSVIKTMLSALEETAQKDEQVAQLTKAKVALDEKVQDYSAQISDLSLKVQSAKEIAYGDRVKLFCTNLRNDNIHESVVKEVETILSSLKVSDREQKFTLELDESSEEIDIFSIFRRVLDATPKSARLDVESEADIVEVSPETPEFAEEAPGQVASTELSEKPAHVVMYEQKYGLVAERKMWDKIDEDGEIDWTKVGRGR